MPSVSYTLGFSAQKKENQGLSQLCRTPTSETPNPQLQNRAERVITHSDGPERIDASRMDRVRVRNPKTELALRARPVVFFDHERE